MVSYDELMTWQPRRLASIAEQLNSDRKRLGDIGQDLHDGRPPETWTGKAARAGLESHQQVWEALESLRDPIPHVIRGLDTAADAITKAQDRARAAKEYAESRGWHVSFSGGGVSIEARDDPEADQAAVSDCAQDIIDALNDGDQADSDLASVLASATHEDHGAFPGVPGIVEDTHKVLEWGERGLKGLKVLGKDVMEGVDAAKAEAARESKNVLSEVWNEMKSESWGKAGELGETWGKVAGDAAIGVGGAIAGWDQWKEDSEDKDLTTGERVDRTATKAGMVVAGQMMGAAGGEAVGGAAGGLVGTVVPGIGNAAGAAAGAYVGEMAGAVAGGIAGDKFADVVNDHYNGAGHAVAHFWHKYL